MHIYFLLAFIVINFLFSYLFLRAVSTHLTGRSPAAPTAAEGAERRMRRQRRTPAISGAGGAIASLAARGCLRGKFFDISSHLSARPSQRS